MNRLKAFINKCGLLYAAYICKREYAAQSFVSINERPIEFEFLFRMLTQRWPQTVLDVGTGKTALPHLMRNCGFCVTATDNVKDYWPFGMINRHYHVIDDDICNTKLQDTYDFISCISVIEHIVDHKKALRNMLSLLKPGGVLVITFPYNENNYVNNVYKLPDSSVTEIYPFITQCFSRKELNDWFDNSDIKVIKQEYWQLCSGDFWTCGDRVIPPVQVDVNQRHQVTCLAIEKRSTGLC